MDNHPTTLPQAVDRLLEELNDDLKEEIRSMPPSEPWRYHHTVGHYVRNEFGLWAGNDALLTSCQKARHKNAGILKAISPDDASATIIEALWERLWVGGER